MIEIISLIVIVYGILGGLWYSITSTDQEIHSELNEICRCVILWPLDIVVWLKPHWFIREDEVEFEMVLDTKKDSDDA